MNILTTASVDYLKVTLRSWWFGMTLIMGIFRVLEKWFDLNLPIPRWALICFAVLGFTMAQYKAYERLHRQREKEALDRDAERKRYEKEMADRDAEIRQLKESFATTKVHEKKDEQLKFDFRLYSKPGDWSSMEMVFASASNVVAIPFIGILVSNKAERHIEVVKS